MKSKGTDHKMTRKITKNSNGKYELTPQQAAAIDLLLSGQSVTAAAEAIGVERETLSRWRNHDPAFIAAFNERLAVQWEANGAKLLEAKGKALDTLIALLDNENTAVRLKAAAALVRIDTPRPMGETEPEEVNNPFYLKF